ncbi:NADP-dependent 3-hydroxy acid dehydrogenase YdfG [Saccharopolyspora antimicrobica]|uniref:NADP-dependent 3-hydroxy acid dehydrogenase YdfG n=1 Tax=Saccharopolyspora antimicrobica TaxID=455193 RepID=A0A1I4VS93_9PSEU|nr:SDR family NAD(P)-dependent oxidoreductase [Saccharopolyspora antimicrobica]RKT87230.1 NADP-dependent 3-hydroxy acid dehydrogenase YdfG [Saccharopolyspora antimicrobica]SFN04124.1 NADP-dependent 3-hydroxy acid dehydrogenase YdfG [Saccharopolyspora antimicrobica]
MSPSRAVLITGVSSHSGRSSGTGRATALRLHRAGWPVYATGRNLDGLKDLAEEGITTLRVDVTDEESMTAAVDRITEEHGAVGVLINNAAYSLNGTIGETPLEQVHRQFETNFFGLSRMTQLVLPGMREQRSGRIVMMSSIFGLFATPGRGYYQATKHALEAISDSLRLEVAPWGIKVAIIEPSPILGSFVPTTVGDLDLATDSDLYADFWERFVRWHGAYREVDRPKGRGRTAVRAARVAEVVEKAITARRPRIRYRIGIPVRLLGPQRAIFGDRAWEAFVTRFFPQP